MTILHLLGCREDVGGILSTLRGLAVATPTKAAHSAWVHRSFRQTRLPPLDLRRARWACDESSHHPALLARNLLAFPGLLLRIRKDRPDIVHAHTRGSFPLAVLLHRMGRRGVLFTNHTYARNTGLYRRAAQAGLPTVLLTPNMARHYGLEPSPGRVEIVSECCDPAWFDRPVPPRPVRSPDAPLHLVGIGSVVRWKNWTLVPEALSRLPADRRSRIRFTLWGPVPEDPDARRYAAELEERIATLGLSEQIRLAGPTRDVPAVLAGADGVLVTSVNEPCSVALIEALASGRPALAAASGGNVDILRDGTTGRLFRPEDPADLADALGAWLEGRFTPAPAGVIRESVRHRSATVVGPVLLDLYRRLLVRPHPAP